MTAIDPLTVSCIHCGAEPGSRCMAVSGQSPRPHARRRGDARAVADERERILAGVKALARIVVLRDGCPVRVVSQYELEQLIGGGS